MKEKVIFHQIRLFQISLKTRKKPNLKKTQILGDCSSDEETAPHSNLPNPPKPGNKNAPANILGDSFSDSPRPIPSSKPQKKPCVLGDSSSDQAEPAVRPTQTKAREIGDSSGDDLPVNTGKETKAKDEETKGKKPAIIAQRMQDNSCVLTGFDNLIQITDRPFPDRPC